MDDTTGPGMGRTIVWPEGTDEQARAWRAGALTTTTPYTPAVCAGLLSLLGDRWGPVLEALPEPRPGQRTLQRWLTGQTAPTGLEWRGLVTVVLGALAFGGWRRIGDEVEGPPARALAHLPTVEGGGQTLV